MGLRERMHGYQSDDIPTNNMLLLQIIQCNHVDKECNTERG